MAIDSHFFGGFGGKKPKMVVKKSGYT